MPDPQQDANPYAQMYQDGMKKIAPSASAVAAPAQPPSMLHSIGEGALNLGKGAVKGLGSTMNSIGTQLGKVPGVGSMLPKDVTDTTPEEMRVIPHGTMQHLGKGIEQTAEFVAPGIGEEAGAAKIASMLPRLGKAALPLAKIGTSALSSGLVNKAQGGEFGTGAIAGGAGAVEIGRASCRERV